MKETVGPQGPICHDMAGAVPPRVSCLLQPGPASLERSLISCAPPFPPSPVAVATTNLGGALLCSRAAIRLFEEQRGGQLFLTLGAGSDGGATPLYSAYGSTKARSTSSLPPKRAPQDPGTGQTRLQRANAVSRTQPGALAQSLRPLWNALPLLTRVCPAPSAPCLPPAHHRLPSASWRCP